MSAVKHTPGPWRTNRLANYEEPGHVVLWLDTSKAGVRGRRLDYKGCFTHADATLIAAAPDLLAVARELAEAAAYWSEYDVPLGLADRLNAAIAKATEAP